VGNNWKILAEKLGLKRARIQSIQLEAEGSMTEAVTNMLITWFKYLPANADKVGVLQRALYDSDLWDTANDLLYRNSVHQIEVQRRIEEDNWKKVYQSIASTPALRGWKTLAKSLGICLEDITVIEEENWSIRTKCLKMLDMWRNASGPLATRPVLVKALKACKFMEAAGKIQQIV